MNFQIFGIAVCIIWAVAIAIMDLISYRIYNSALAFGIVLVWPALYLIGQTFDLSLTVLIFSVLVISAGLASLLGMGDAKLLLFLAPWLRYDNVRYPLIILILVSWFQLLAGIVIKRRIPQRIAFAPAILAAAVLNMAT